MYDVCIVGAGPAGLNAALILGRCGRRVIVFDSGQPRNAAARALHGFLTRDGTNPHELRAMGRRELAKYPTVELVDGQVATAQRKDAAAFEVVTVAGRAVTAKILLLATGRIDVLPDLPGIREFYGHGVHHCPYCDGWEHRGQPILVHGAPTVIADFALELLTWTREITVSVDGAEPLNARDGERLANNGIRVAPAALAAVDGRPDCGVTGVRLEDGTKIPCQAVFFVAALPQKSPLAQTLGCSLDDGGSVVCQAHAATGVRGLYVAGNVRGGVHLAIMAAAEGAEAAIAINEELADRELRGTRDGQPARTTSLDERPGAKIPTK